MREQSEEGTPASLGPYVVLGKLGEGGMGEVLLALDPRLDRKVALKILPAALCTEPDRRSRFLREARAVAHLTHPNVTQIFEIGEADGRDFIAFEHVEGETLQTLLARKRLDLQEILELALPLADAVGYSHEQGIVHRDLKSSNVMVTERGHAKLLDFGLAKFLEAGAPGGDKRTTTLSMRGAIFGTPCAMSPEQALGKPVDARSDVFSFGSLLYEMAVGRPAFAGTTAMEVMDAVIHADPDHVARLRPDLPDEFVAIVEKAQRKDAAERYQSMSGLLADLRHLKRHTDSGLVPPAAERSAGLRSSAALGALALAALLAVVWIFRPTRSANGSAPGALEANRFLGVMFFENVTDPADEGHLGVMLTHLLTSELSAGESLTVLSQQRLFETARQAGSADGSLDRGLASEVARRAGIGAMVLGEIHDTSGRIVSTASIVDVDSGAVIGACRAEGAGAADVFALAEVLGAGVREILAPTAATAGAKPGAPTQSVDAYRAYVRGRELLMGKYPYFDAIDAFGEAVTIDPSFALAHYWRAIGQSYVDLTDEAAVSLAKAAAFQGALPVEVRRTLPVFELYLRGEHGEILAAAEELFRSDPENLLARYMTGEVYLHSPTHQDSARAVDAFERLLRIDPGFALVHDHLVAAYLFDGRADEARNAIDGWKLAPEERDRHQLRIAGFLGRIDEMAPLVARLGGESDLFSIDRLAEDWAGLREHMEEPLDDWDGQTPAPALAVPRLEGQSDQLLCIGAFRRALALLERVPESVEGTEPNGWAACVWVGALFNRAELQLLRGERAEALRLADAFCADQPESYRALYAACLVAADAGDGEAVRARAARLAELAALERSPTAARYRQAAAAEVALLDGDPAEARRLLQAVVDADRFMEDWWVSNQSYGPWIRSRLARACLAAGDSEGARRALRALVDSGAERIHQPLAWLPALHRLGLLERAAGRTDEARDHLERFLAAWGEAEWELDSIAEARAALVELR